MLSPPSAKKLSSIPTAATPSTSANSAHRISSCGVRGARPLAQLAAQALAAHGGRACRSASAEAVEHHKARRHHVVGKRFPTCARNACASIARPRSPQPHRPISRFSLPPRAQSPPPAPHRHGAAAPPRSRRLNAKAAQLHLRIGAPEKLQNPVRAPARQIPAAVHPAACRPIRIRNKPLRRKPRTPEIAAPAPLPQCKAPPQPPQAQAADPIQHVHPRVPDRPPNRDRVSSSPTRA